jgi:hypothetical protein
VGVLLKPITWPLKLVLRLVGKVVRFAAVSAAIGAVLLILDAVLLQYRRRDGSDE